MAAYLTQHLPSPTAARHLSIIHLDRDGRNMKTTIIPPLPPSTPNPTASITTTNTTLTANSNSTAAPVPSTGTPSATFSLSTLAHFLHAFHTAYNSHIPPSHPYQPTTNSSNSTSTSVPVTNPNSAHPHFDLAESKTGYTIYGSLAGLQREDVTVETDDLLFTITISGVIPRPVPGPVRGPIPGEDESSEVDEREKNNREKEGEEMLHWHVEERRVGPFCRVFHLPVGLEDMACVQASMRDGLLIVTVPKTVAEIYREEVSRRRRVEVGTGEGVNMK